MSRENITFCCYELTTSTSYENSSISVECHSAELSDIISSAGISAVVNSCSDVDGILDCIGVSDVITWLSNNGYDAIEQE